MIITDQGRQAVYTPPQKKPLQAIIDSFYSVHNDESISCQKPMIEIIVGIALKA